MHEIYLVKNIIQILEEEFSSGDLDQLRAIDLKVGELSNAEPQLMQNAFKALTETSKKYQSVKLNIEMIPISIYCQDCNSYTIIDNYRFICTCGRSNNNVVQGMELTIHRLHFDE